MEKVRETVARPVPAAVPGLYDKRFEHDNCGIGAVANIKGHKSHKTVEQALHIVDIRERYEGNDYAGVITGLAWTAAGGCVLYVETSLSPSKGEKLTLTGKLGDVMKESASIALQHVRSHADSLGIASDALTDRAVHIHVPEGAIPKDGPSAGITMATSIVSALTGRRPKPRVAMTGELTLRGKVLPIGDILI